MRTFWLVLKTSKVAGRDFVKRLKLGSGQGQGLFGMVGVSFRSWGMHQVCDRPHNDRSTRVYVCVFEESH